MNANLLAVVNRIVAEQGEGILADAKRLFPYFSDYAKNEPKEERVAFGRCIEMGAYQELKRTRAPDERLRVKATLANQINTKTGIDWKHCADALDLLEAVIFKTQQPQYPQQANMPLDVNVNMTINPQPQYLPQSSSPAAKKTKSKKPVIIAIAAVVAVIILAVVIISGIRASNIPAWEGYVSFEDFARAAEINDILSVGELNEKGFYALMGGAFAGSILGPFISGFMGAYGIHVTVTAKIDLVKSAELGEKYNVPPELWQNCDYLVRRTGKRGSKTYLALRFDGERVFGVFIPYSGWIVMVYEEGMLIKY
jgi:hypothetical protein